MSAALTREEWIAAHGSERLRRCIAEGLECEAVYRDERLAAERPGWRFLDGTKLEDARNPPMAAFAMLDEAREIEPTASLRFIRGSLFAPTAEPSIGIRTDTGTYVAVEPYYLGRPIVYARPASVSR